jgi:hypothetical protein
VGGCNYRRLASDVWQTAVMRQDVVRWKNGRVDSPLLASYPAAKTTLQAPTLRVCAWITQGRRVGLMVWREGVRVVGREACAGEERAR